ncbi:hypothetical protein AB3662_27745 [Sorangium cellulosum]|uniref:hypothetical protein n=1 Tax=Sorangium cellulosum TaxID=56 RepID=UPI003D9A4BCF
MTCPRSSLRGALCVLSLCVLSLGSLRVASAAPQRPRLAVHRAPSAADCPDAPSLAAAVERVMKQPALDPVSTPAAADGAPAAAGSAAAAADGAPAAAAPAPSLAGDAPSTAGAAAPGAGTPPSADGVPEYEVHFLRTETTYTAVLQAGGRARQLSSEAGAACGELVEALALTIAILLDSEPAPAPPPAAPAPPPAAPEPVVPARRPAPPPPARQPPSWDVSAELGAAGTVGMLDPFRAAATGGVSLRRRAWSAGLGAVWLPRQDIDIEPGVASIGLVAATARGCATIAGELDEVRLSACAASMLGAVHGAGKGFSPNREDSALWFAVGGSAIAEGPLFGTPALGWSARATLLAPIARARFTVDRRAGSDAGAPVTTDAVLDPSPVGLLVGLGARVSIF